MLAVTLSEVSDVMLPIAPLNKIDPLPQLRFRFWPPFRVLEKVILLFVLAIVLPPISLTGRAKIKGFDPAIVIELPIWTSLAEVKIRLAKGILPPTAPEKITLPALPAMKVRELAPFKVLGKLILAPVDAAPPFVVSKVALLVTVIGPFNPIADPFVVIELPILMLFDPV